MTKEYKIIAEKYFEHILDDLNQHAREGWTAILSAQERGVTKVILEREVCNEKL